MDQWIDPVHQRPIVRSIEGIGLIAKYVEDRVDGLARLKFRCEPDGLKVLPGLVLVLDQGGIKHRFEVRGRVRRLGSRLRRALGRAGR